MLYKSVYLIYYVCLCALKVGYIRRRDGVVGCLALCHFPVVLGFCLVVLCLLLLVLYLSDKVHVKIALESRAKGICKAVLYYFKRVYALVYLVRERVRGRVALRSVKMLRLKHLFVLLKHFDGVRFVLVRLLGIFFDALPCVCDEVEHEVLVKVFS